MDELTAVAGRTCRRSAGAVTRCGGALALAASVTLAGTVACYTSTPLLGPPNPGAEVAATLNDRGRVALGDSVGTDVDVVEGRVRTRSDSSMVLAVSRVRTFSGQVTRWTGEPVTLRMSSLRGLQERRAARAQTLGLVAGASVLLVALILSRSLAAGGTGTLSDTPQTPPNGS